MIVVPMDIDYFTPYKYRVKKKGNNSKPIIKALKARWWWVKAAKREKIENINFLWEHGRNEEFIELLKPFK